MNDIQTIITNIYSWVYQYIDNGKGTGNVCDICGSVYINVSLINIDNMQCCSECLSNHSDFDNHC